MIDLDKIMLNSENVYGITINPSEQCLDSHNDEQFVSTMVLFMKHMTKYKNILPYIELYPEYSPGKIFNKKEPPRLHFHGCATVDPFKYYTYGSRKILQTQMIAFNNSPDYDYCTKNSEQMKDFSKAYHLPYPLKWESIEAYLKSDIGQQWAERALDGAHPRVQLKA